MTWSTARLPSSETYTVLAEAKRVVDVAKSIYERCRRAESVAAFSSDDLRELSSAAHDLESAIRDHPAELERVRAMESLREMRRREKADLP